jgi:hypothetical protein
MSTPERPGYESPADRAIREAIERGEFDNLPGAGKPLTNLGDPDDALWWVRRLAEREQLDLSATLPPAIALRKEAATFPESLAGLRIEAAVLEDFNRRVRRDRLRPPDPGMPQLLARTVDVDAVVEQWRRLRAERAATRATEPAPADPGPGDGAAGGRAAHTRWWSRWWRRGR